MEKRIFTVVSCSVGKPGGRYVVSTSGGPAGAAKKAASKRFTGKNNKMRLTIRQTGTDKEMSYEACRVKLDKPIVRTVGGVEIVTKYRVDVKSV